MELVSELDVEPEFTNSHSFTPRKKKRLFSYESKNNSVQDPKERYRIEFFNVLTNVSSQRKV